MKLVDCYQCEHCRGIKVLQCLVVDKATGEIIEINDVATYDCDIFDIITEDNECYQVKVKELDNTIKINLSEN